MDMQKTVDGRFMISFNDRDDEKDVDSFMTHSHCSLTLFLTGEQLEKLQSLSVPEEPAEQEKEDGATYRG